MSVIKDLLFAVMGANGEKVQYDHDGEHYETSKKENEAKPHGSGGADWNSAEGEPGHILNKPFGAETAPDFVFTEVNIANPIERIELPDGEGIAYVKVSDRVFTADELSGMSVTYIVGGDNLEPVTTTELFIDKDHTMLPTGILFSSINDGTALGVVNEQETNMGFRISTGLWLIDYGSIIGNTKILSVTIPGKETIKQLDSKFLNPALQFGETTVKGDTLTWDGQIGDHEVVDFYDSTACLIGAAKITEDDLRDGLTFTTSEGEIQSYAFELIKATIDAGGSAFGGAFMDELFAIVPTDNLIIEGDDGQIVFPKAGVYALFTGGFNNYLASLTIPGYTGFETTTIKRLDEKYMPILTSPGGKKFKIAVNDDGTLTAAEIN